MSAQEKAKPRIKRIRIRNVLGIEELEVEPGAVTVVEGANGTGKTSFVAAIKALVGGGHDHTLIRVGAEAGEVVLVLDDETELRRRITPSGSRLEISNDGAVQKAPQTWLDRMTDAVALNPIAFLEASPKDQARMLLEAMPVTVSGEELREAVGGHWDDGPVDGHGLEVVERVRATLYDDRTGVNRLAREHAATAKQLEEAVPVANADVDGVASVIAEELEERQQDADQLEQERRERQEKLRAKHQAAVDKLTAEANTRIEDLKQQIRAIYHHRDRTIAQYGTALAEHKAEIDKDIDRKAAAIRERMTELRGQAKRVEEAERTRKALDDQREKLAARKAESDALTAALGHLDALKATLLERLPMRGLTVRDGVLYRGEIPFHRLNKAEQVKAALRLGTIRAGDIPIVCADGLEALDPETFEAFVAAAHNQDVHLFVTRVTSDSELVIKTDRREVAHA